MKKSTMIKNLNKFLADMSIPKKIVRKNGIYIIEDEINPEQQKILQDATFCEDELYDLEEPPWDLVQWDESDIREILNEIGIPDSKINMERAKYALKGVFDPQQDRLELIRQTMIQEFSDLL